MTDLRLRRRRRREQAQQFTVVAVASRCPTVWDQWGDDLAERGAAEYVDGLGGRWRLSPDKAKAASPKERHHDKLRDGKGNINSGGGEGATYGELRSSGVAAKLRTPKRLGAMNELQIVAGDVIRVVGACNPDGTHRRHVRRADVRG